MPKGEKHTGGPPPKGSKRGLGNLGPRNFEAAEKRARLKAAITLNTKLLPICVDYMLETMQSTTSTRFDKQAVCNAVLDRTFPKVTQNELTLKNAPPVLLMVEGGLGWPADRRATVEIPEAVAVRAGLPHNGNGNGASSA